MQRATPRLAGASVAATAYQAPENCQRGVGGHSIETHVEDEVVEVDPAVGARPVPELEDNVRGAVPGLVGEHLAPKVVVQPRARGRAAERVGYRPARDAGHDPKPDDDGRCPAPTSDCAAAQRLHRPLLP